MDLIDIEQRNEDAAELLVRCIGENYREVLHEYNVAEHVDREYPPCYIVCGKDDQVVGFHDSELLKKLLDQSGVPVVLDAADHAPHGFGDGTGTALEGWPERAIAFLQKLS